LPYVWEVFAGQPGTPGIDDGVGREARLAGPQGLALDDAGALYVADGRGNAIRKISSEGRVTTLAGVPGTFASPIGIAVDRAATCYVTDGSNRLWKVSATGGAAKMAGAGGRGFLPGVAVGLAGHLYVADYAACAIRKVTPAGEVSLFAGRPGQDENVDGVGASACFRNPQAVAADAAGNLFVAAGNRLRRVTPAGAVTTPAEGAPFGQLDGVACDAAGNAYVADRGRHVIWRVTPRGAFVRL
jgi:sugar lactone lactonase YvrE